MTLHRNFNATEISMKVYRNLGISLKIHRHFHRGYGANLRMMFVSHTCDISLFQRELPIFSHF